MEVKANLKMLVLVDELTGEKHKIATVRPVKDVAFSARSAEWEYVKMEMEDTAEALCNQHYKSHQGAYGQTQSTGFGFIHGSPNPLRCNHPARI